MSEHDRVQVKSLPEAETHIAALHDRCKALERRMRHTEKQLDTRATPLWKRVLFRIDGWPPWYVVAERRAWRPWHRWLPSS